METLVVELISKCYYGRSSREVMPAKSPPPAQCRRRRQSCENTRRIPRHELHRPQTQGAHHHYRFVGRYSHHPADLFVVSTTFKKDQPEVQINLPESKTATNAPAELEHAIVSVDQNDEIKLDGRTLGVDELEAAVRNLPPTRKSSLALQADKKASFGAIVKVMDALKLAGVRNLPASRVRKNEIADLAVRRPMLRAKGKRIDQIDDRIRELAANMLETMQAANGVGLARKQVDEALQLTVLDISRVEDRPEHHEVERPGCRYPDSDAARLDQSRDRIGRRNRNGHGRLPEFSGNHR